jgi:hypothetical protein
VQGLLSHEERQNRQIKILQRCAGSKQERLAARKLFNQGVQHARTILVTALMNSGLSKEQAEDLPGWLESVAEKPDPNELAAIHTLNKLHFVAYYASSERRFTCSLGNTALERRALAWQAPAEPRERSRFEVMKLWRYCNLQDLVTAIAVSTARMGAPVTAAALELLRSHTDFWVHRSQPFHVPDSDLWGPVGVFEPLCTVAVHAASFWRQLPADWLAYFARCGSWLEESVKFVDLSHRNDLCELLNLLFSVWRERGGETPMEDSMRGERGGEVSMGESMTLGEYASDLMRVLRCNMQYAGVP